MYTQTIHAHAKSHKCSWQELVTAQKPAWSVHVPARISLGSTWNSCLLITKANVGTWERYKFITYTDQTAMHANETMLLGRKIVSKLECYLPATSGLEAAILKRSLANFHEGKCTKSGGGKRRNKICLELIYKICEPNYLFKKKLLLTFIKVNIFRLCFVDLCISSLARQSIWCVRLFNFLTGRVSKVGAGVSHVKTTTRKFCKHW